MDLMIPFNSISGDRVYDADDIAEMFRAVITDGVHPSPGDSLMVKAAGGWNLEVAPGRCAIRGRLGVNNTVKTLTVAAPSGSLPRVDAVVIRCDFLARELIETIKQGVPSQSPEAPALRRDELVWELCLAHVSIEPTATAISQSNIFDTRQNGGLCGVMHSLIEVDPTDLFAQYGDIWLKWFDNTLNDTIEWQEAMVNMFEQWLETVQDLLDENMAANLAGAVADLRLRQQALESERAGTMYEIARQEGTVRVEEWGENTALGLWEAIVTNEHIDPVKTDVTVVIAPAGLKQPILGAGEALNGAVKLFAAKQPDEDAGYRLIIAGRRS